MAVGTLDQAAAGVATCSGTNSLSETTWSLAIAFAPLGFGRFQNPAFPLARPVA